MQILQKRALRIRNLLIFTFFQRVGSPLQILGTGIRTKISRLHLPEIIYFLRSRESVILIIFLTDSRFESSVFMLTCNYVACSRANFLFYLLRS